MRRIVVGLRLGNGNELGTDRIDLRISGGGQGNRENREQFLICCLDAKHAIIGVNVVSIGSLTLSIVHPREVFKPAILLNSCGIIAAHNHPSGDPSPSPEDRTLTARLRQAGELIGIALLDHIVLSDDRIYSFADQGWAC
ncbi:MAG: hypothetical protein H0V35_12865 [Nitrospira sp.]|nr:hypothetical protein [Nitrospira sp.]